MKRKMIAIFMCMALFLSITPVLANGTEVVAELEYRIDNMNRTAAVKGIKNPETATKIIIPATANDNGTSYPVTKIKDGALDNLANLKVVDMSKATNLNTIGVNVFRSLPSLKEIKMDSNNASFTVENNVLFNKDQSTLLKYPADKEGTNYKLPAKVQTIERYAFAGNKNLVNIDFSMANNLVTIENNAFMGMQALDVMDLSGAIKLETIGDGVFQASSFSKIVFPTNLKSIGTIQFINCENLSDIVISSDAPNFTITDGVLYNKDKTILIAYPPNKADTHFKVPETVNIIRENSFQTALHLTHLSIPNSVKEIKQVSMADMPKLSSVVVGRGVTSVDYAAFAGNANLKDVVFLSDTSTFGNNVFSWLPTDFTIHGHEGSTVQTYAGKQSPVVNFSSDPVLLVDGYYEKTTEYDKNGGGTLSLLYTGTLDDTAVLKFGDKELVKDKDFTLKKDGKDTQITLSKTLMQSLINKSYTFTAQAGTRTASLAVNVSDTTPTPETKPETKPDKSPATADVSNAPVGMMFASLAVMVGILMKKRYAK